MNEKIREIVYIRVINALVVALITFFSSLSIVYPPGLANIYAAGIACALTFLVQAKTLTEELLKVTGNLEDLKSIEEIKKELEKEEKRKEGKTKDTMSKFLLLL